jgi:polysaccharide biosynthesis/export protein
MRDSRKVVFALRIAQAALFVLALALALAGPVSAQQTQPSPLSQPVQSDNPQATPAPGGQTQQQPLQQLPPDTIRPNYVLGPNDQILIRAPEAEEIDNRPFRIDGDGNINLPLVGRIHAAGMTLQELEADLVKRLREFIREPQVFIQINQFRSEPVFFVGMFARPGAYPLQGNRTLIEMLTSVGGLLPNADRHIKLTRREEYGVIPLPDAVVDPEKKVSTVEISLGSLRQNLSPAENILLQPYDEVSVGRAELVYVNGEVLKVGGFELGERDSISIAQVLSQAGGFSREAKKSKVRILRPIEGTSRRAVIEVNAAQLFEGKALDVPLLPGDIVYVPRSLQLQFWEKFGSTALTLLPYIIFAITQ